MKEQKPLGLAIALGWLVPGLGHVIMRRPQYGAFFGVVILGLVIAGMTMSQMTGVDFDHHPIYFVCQIGAGLVVLVSQFVFGGEPVGLGESIGVLSHQSGVVYIAVAGVLNLIAICELVRRHQSPDAPGPADTMRADAIEEMKKQQEDEE